MMAFILFVHCTYNLAIPSADDGHIVNDVMRTSLVINRVVC